MPSMRTGSSSSECDREGENEKKNCSQCWNYRLMTKVCFLLNHLIASLRLYFAHKKTFFCFFFEDEARLTIPDVEPGYVLKLFSSLRLSLDLLL